MRKIIITQEYLYTEDSTQQGLWGPEIPGRTVSLNKELTFDVVSNLVPYSEEEGIVTAEGFVLLSALPTNIYRVVN